MERLMKSPCSRRLTRPTTSASSSSALRLVSATLSGSERSKVSVQLLVGLLGREPGDEALHYLWEAPGVGRRDEAEDVRPR